MVRAVPIPNSGVVTSRVRGLRWVQLALVGLVLPVGVGISAAESSSMAADVGGWTRAADPAPNKKGHAVARLDDGNLLVTGGDRGGEHPSAMVEVYDPEEDRWSRAEPMTYERRSHEIVGLGDGRVMVAGGTRGEADAPLAEIYEPDAAPEGRWREVTGPPVALVNSLTLLEGPECDDDLVGAEWCHTVLAVGRDGAATFDPDTEQWTQAGTPAGVYPSDGGVVRLDGVQCEGGDAPLWCGRVLAANLGTAEVYEPEARVWRPTAPLLNPRSQPSLVSLDNGQVLAVGGDTVDPESEDPPLGPAAAAELYTPMVGDPADDQWDPQDAGWREAGELQTPRARQEAVLLPDVDGDGPGRVLVVGGEHPDVGRCGLSSVELFDTAGDDGEPGFLQGPVVAQARDSHTLTPLDDGGALVLGGVTSSCGWGSAERYHQQAPQEPPDVGQLLPDSAVVDGGVTVSIRGAYFTGAEEVRFGDVPAEEFTVHNYEEITAVAPPHAAGTVEVRVKTPQGGWSSREDAGPEDRDDDAAFRYAERAGVWTQVGELDHSPNSDVKAVSLGTAGVLAVYEDEDSNPRAAVYDPQSDSVAAAADPPVEPHIAAPLPGGQALIADGSSPSGDYEAAVYSPEEDGWELTSEAPHFRVQTGNAVRLDDGRVLAVTVGEDGETKSQVYEPGDDAWHPTTGQPAEDVAHGGSAVLVRLGDGRVLVAAGGGSDTGRHGQAQVFDPVEEVWRSAPEGVKRADHAGVRLGHGEALVSGGRGVGGSLPGTQSFDAEGGDETLVGAWQPQDFMVYTRIDHTLVRLLDGSVLAVGGEAYGDHPRGGEHGQLRIAEVFRPDAAFWQWQPTGSSGDARTRPGVVRLQEGCADRCGHVVAMGGWKLSSVERYVPRPRIVDVEPGQAPAGTEVTITGFDLAAVDRVWFGGESVEPSVDEVARGPESPGRITATVPPGGEGAAPLRVTTGVDPVEGPSVLASNEVSFDVGSVPSGGDDGEDGDGSEDGSDDRSEGTPGGGADGVGQVEDVGAVALSTSEVVVSWSAVADGAGGVADRYVVAQSRTAIHDGEDFDAALALCGGVCGGFDPPPHNVGDGMTLTVGGLSPAATYHYAVAAVGADGERGPISSSVAVTTDGDVAAQTPDEGSGDGSGAESVASSVVRVSGPDRVATALAASQEAFDAGQAPAAVLARADVFADGLAGVPLAAANEGPLLVTGSDGLDERVATELQRAVAAGGRVFLLGGPAALSDQIEQQLAELGFEPLRLAGADRFETAAVIAEQGLGAPGRVLVATGGEFADAVTAGAAAARADAAVLLSAGDRLPQATASYLDRQEVTERYAVGGPAANAVSRAEVLAGATRYETAATVADAFFPEPATVGLATGVRFPDALSGGAHIARYGGPMLLSGADRLHPAAVSYLSDRAATIGTGVLYGGVAALGQPVADEASAAITAGS